MFAKMTHLFALLLRTRVSFDISQFSRSLLFISLIISFIKLTILNGKWKSLSNA